ncbi:MAG: hypothetical protein QOE65_2174 [Solirubrobacteraceae bacterium]|jgi:hypothetical protein|nr:hypothetical protein [Solirubrobacteraceae bacterium]
MPIRPCITFALCLLAGLVAASPAAGRDYGRWRMALTGEIHKQWSAPATTPCAITGSGGVDLRFSASKTLRLRWVAASPRSPAHWDAGRTVFTFPAAASGRTSASAVRQPPSDPERTCSWPDPQSWSCGAFAYSAPSLIQGAWLRRPPHPSGFLVKSSDRALSPSAHEPADSVGCFEASTIDYTLGDSLAGKALYFQLPGPARVAGLRRIAVSETGAATTGSNFDEPNGGSFPVTDRFQRRSQLVLTRLP